MKRLDLALKSNLIGIISILIYNVLFASKSVFVGSLLQNLDPLVATVACFLVILIIFNLGQITRPREYIREIRANWREIIGVNFSTAVDWICTFISFKYLEPAIAVVIGFASQPLITTVLTPWLWPKNKILLGEKISALGILLSIGFLISSSLAGQTAVGSIASPLIVLGVVCAILTAGAGSMTTIFTKRLASQGWSFPKLMAARFYLIVFGGAMFLAGKQAPVEVAPEVFLLLSLVAVLGIVIPLLFFFAGVKRVEPIVASIVASMAPIFVFALQFLDERLSWSPQTLVGICLSLVFCLVGVMARFSNAKSPVKKRVAIIDAYSGGAYVGQKFVEMGFECVHVNSTDIPSAVSGSFRDQDYMQNILFSGDVAKLIEQLQELKVGYVVAGHERSVELADQLAESMGLAGNGTNLSLAKRDKFEMGQVLRRNGLRDIGQIKSDNLEEVLEWAKAMNSWPLIIKPPSSCGSDGTRICQDLHEVRKSFGEICHRVNKMGIENQSVVLEEFLHGDEYMVDTVSSNGRHVVTDVWISKKIKINGSDFTYDYMELLDPENPVVMTLANYSFKVLNALEVQFGPAHHEIMLTPKGPILIEVGVRMSGCNIPPVASQCSSIDPCVATVLAFTSYHEFLALPQIYLKTKEARLVAMIATREGLIKEIPGKSEIESLSSFHRFFLSAQPGKFLKLTTDLYNLPGYIALISNSPNTVEADYRMVREIENSRMFDLYELLGSREQQCEERTVLG